MGRYVTDYEARTTGGVLECSGPALSAGETVVVRSDKATVSVRVHGYEEV